MRIHTRTHTHFLCDLRFPLNLFFSCFSYTHIHKHLTCLYLGKHFSEGFHDTWHSCKGGGHTTICVKCVKGGSQESHARVIPPCRAQHNPPACCSTQELCSLQGLRKCMFNTPDKQEALALMHHT